MQIQLKIDSALPGGCVLVLKAQKILFMMLLKASERLLFPNFVRNFTPIFGTREVFLPLKKVVLLMNFRADVKLGT